MASEVGQTGSVRVKLEGITQSQHLKLKDEVELTLTPKNRLSEPMTATVTNFCTKRNRAYVSFQTKSGTQYDCTFGLQSMHGSYFLRMT